MRFDPQSNYVADGAAGDSAARRFLPRGGLRGQVVAFVTAVAAVLAVWIWQQTGSPASAVGADQAASTPKADPKQTDTSRDAGPSPAAGPEHAPPAEAVDAPASAVDRDPVTTEQASNLDFNYTAESPEQRSRRAADLLAAGKRALSAGRSRAAIRTLREVVELDPDLADAHYNLGLAYVLAGETESARVVQRDLEKLDPSLASLLGNLVH